MKVRKITNISEFEVAVVMQGGNAVVLHTGQVLENVDVQNLTSISQFVRVEQDLAEVPVREGKTYLKG
jgi:hypothetical protein